MTCRNCGVYLSGNSGYCPNCGTLRRPEPAVKKPPALTAPGAPPREIHARRETAVGMGRYLLWWTIALFSNAEIVCLVLSIVFVFDGGDRNRANFFRAVLLFKLCLLLIGVVVVIVLLVSGFSFNELLNRVGPAALWNLFREVF